MKTDNNYQPYGSAGTNRINVAQGWHISSKIEDIEDLAPPLTMEEALPKLRKDSSTTYPMILLISIWEVDY